jgi:mannitol-specific phosphotransferase system IIBC component
MEKEIASKVIEQGIVGIFIALMLIFLFLVVKFLVLPMIKKEKKEDKDKLDANTEALKKLTDSVKSLESAVNHIPKLQEDMRRSFIVHRILAGDKWSEIRKEILEEERIK